MGRLNPREIRRLNAWSAASTAAMCVSTVGTVTALVTDNGQVLVLSAGFFAVAILCFWGIVTVLQDVAKRMDVPFYIALREAQNDEDEE